MTSGSPGHGNNNNRGGRRQYAPSRGGYRGNLTGYHGENAGPNSLTDSYSSNRGRPLLRSQPASRGTLSPTGQHRSGVFGTDQGFPTQVPRNPTWQNHGFTPRASPYRASSQTYSLSDRPVSSPEQSGGFPNVRDRSSVSHTHRQKLLRSGMQNWNQLQELKIKVSHLPPGTWTYDVYRIFHKFGNIIRIEMQPSRHENSAWVIFRPAPQDTSWFESVRVGPSPVQVEVCPPRISLVPSPIDTGKRYNELTIMHANAIDFGVKVADTSMIVMRSMELHNTVSMTLGLRRKEIEIQHPIIIDKEQVNIRFRLPIALLQCIYKVHDTDTDAQTLIIPFDSPPQFFRQAKGKNMRNTFTSKDRIWSEWDSWYRITDVVDRATRVRLNAQPLMNHSDNSIIDIGRWTTYRLSFDASSLKGPKFDDFCSALSDHNVMVQNLSQYTLKKRVDTPTWTLLQSEITETHSELGLLNKNSASDELLTSRINLPFAVQYQLEACLSNGYLKDHTMTREFLEKLSSMDSEQAIHILEKIMDRQIVYYNPMDALKIQLKGELKRNVPSYCVLSRSATITPSMIHVASPIVETSNRILRKYAADSDRFIRVKFTDEKTEGKLHSQDNNRSEEVFDRIRRAMKKGIVVAGRQYQFLAFGNSQFRDNGAYFYAPTSSKSVKDIIKSMGYFDHIKTVAKLGARLGQCFSTTRAIKSINVRIEMIEDVERNGFNFTDGVGKLSLFLAQMAAQELGLQNPFDDPPSLFQFRLAGCKGVLALDPHLTGSVVHIRKSQYKFEANNVGLEIIRASALASAFFNRQLIIVLSTLGVPDDVFIEKQQEMVNDYELATTNEQVALDKLRKNIDLNQTTLTMAGMILDGFMKSRDPFLMSLLQLWRAYTIKYLKEKARIAIDDGAFVLGSVDETATLRGHYNGLQSQSRDEKLATLPEIFLQISDPANNGHYKIIEGICILARNPSLHAGDIRIVRAVNVSALHHMKNVVVLPQTGDRDIANMCSGGDLDGDDYIVMWDRDFLPETINEEPMDFTPEKPVEKDDPIETEHIIEFFITYMKNDTLARIALAHLAHADGSDEGVRDDKCLELAKLHSQAVDYPKSGVPAVMSRELKPHKFPHFMDNKYRPKEKIRHSKGVLGKLFDQVELADFKPQYENAFDSRILEAFPTSENILKKATEVKISYDSALRRLMAKYSIATEFEAWSVFILGHNQTRDYNFAEEFGKIVGILKGQYRNECLAAANEVAAGELEPFVVAMYTVTAREMDAALKECKTTKIVAGEEVPVRKMNPEHMPLMSFPWLFVNEMGKIATGDARQQPVRGLFPKHPKKGVVKTITHGGTGDIETKEGTTHLGELLSLDFSSTHKSPSPNITPESVSLKEEVQIDDSASGSTRPPSIPDDSSESNDLNEPQRKKVSVFDRLLRFM